MEKNGEDVLQEITVDLRAAYLLQPESEAAGMRRVDEIQ